MYNILETILKEYQAQVLEELSKGYGLDRKMLFQKYHTPSFYQPFVVQQDRMIQYIHKGGHKDKTPPQEQNEKKQA